MHYSHKITWIELHDMFGTVVKSFRTTSDMVDRHVRSLNKSKTVSNITVEKL